jgi:hypothetical protein
MPILRTYSHPTIPGSITGAANVGSTGFQITQGIPALRVPHGQIRENQWASNSAGSRTARTISDTYFPYFINLGILNFLDLIFTVWSWIHPNGQIHPQTARPNIKPTAPRNPRRKNGTLPMAEKCWSTPMGQEVKAVGQAWQFKPGKHTCFRGPS